MCLVVLVTAAFSASWVSLVVWEAFLFPWHLFMLYEDKCVTCIRKNNWFCHWSHKACPVLQWVIRSRQWEVAMNVSTSVWSCLHKSNHRYAHVNSMELLWYYPTFTGLEGTAISALCPWVRVCCSVSVAQVNAAIAEDKLFLVNVIKKKTVLLLSKRSAQARCNQGKCRT